MVDERSSKTQTCSNSEIKKTGKSTLPSLIPYNTDSFRTGPPKASHKPSMGFSQHNRHPYGLIIPVIFIIIIIGSMMWLSHQLRV
ncbi:hypothetical protein F2P81_001625 [Scophthalmus maximus]|uniref:Transmembrane protein n=1 Tax=Scophthalmus maximus TaxID=52904 RepID=A0A6A4TBW1_SCOMX|nr:hypothetical protein F2P81_001625 [Scophthalmus maximus]